VQNIFEPTRSNILKLLASPHLRRFANRLPTLQIIT